MITELVIISDGVGCRVTNVFCSDQPKSSGTLVCLGSPVLLGRLIKELNSIRGFERQLRNRLPLKVKRSLEPIILVIVDVVLGVGARVGVRVLRNLHIERAVLVTQRCPRENAPHRILRVGIVKVTHLSRIGVGKAGIDPGSCRELGRELNVSVHTGGETLIVNSVEHAFVLVVSEG